MHEIRTVPAATRSPTVHVDPPAVGSCRRAVAGEQEPTAVHLLEFLLGPGLGQYGVREDKCSEKCRSNNESGCVTSLAAQSTRRRHGSLFAKRDRGIDDEGTADGIQDAESGPLLGEPAGHFFHQVLGFSSVARRVVDVGLVQKKPRFHVGELSRFET